LIDVAQNAGLGPMPTRQTFAPCCRKLAAILIILTPLVIKAALFSRRHIRYGLSNLSGNHASNTLKSLDFFNGLLAIFVHGFIIKAVVMTHVTLDLL
jgi:hypothetical protein